MTHHHAPPSLEQLTHWRKATHSEAQNNCVEITDQLPGWVGVRDSKLGPDSPLLIFTRARWAAFITSVKDHQL